MIILKDIQCAYLQSVEVELPRANMVIDPRPNFADECPCRFRCEYHENGTTVTLTRTTRADEGMRESGTFSFRVYDPATDIVPSFDSTIYTYMGEDNERAPVDTTVLIIHPSVTVIKEDAFSECARIQKCFMHDGVHTIGMYAFYNCEAMKVIRLSRTLAHIGVSAFEECGSLEAVFLPSSVNKIEEAAFCNCVNLRILPFPLNIDISQLEQYIIEGCHKFFDTTEIVEYHDDANYFYVHSNQVHRAIIRFYRRQIPPLHKASLDTYVTRQTIQECINTHGQATASITDHNWMTPLHILAMNPHADISALLACFHLDMTSVFVEDLEGYTPLDYLRVHRDSIDDHTSLVSSLCMHQDATGGL